MTKHKYAAPFSFGTEFRTTHRTYAAAWAIFRTPESKVPTIGFAKDRPSAQKQIDSCRAQGDTGPAEIASVCVVAK